MPRLRRLGRLFVLASFASLVACGSRSSLFGETDDLDDDFIADGGPDARLLDAARDTDTADAARRDAELHDASDGGFDAAFDARPPPIDASVADADVTGCVAAPIAHVITSGGQVLRFDPATMIATSIGTAACPPEAGGARTMTASRGGTLYVHYTDGNLYAIDAQTLACQKTPFAAGQLGFGTEINFAVARAAGAERLFVLGSRPGVHMLASGDLDAMLVTSIGDVALPYNANGHEVQGDVYDRLFALSHDGVVGQIDPATGAVVAEDKIPGYLPILGWALLAWGKELYAFSAGVGTTVYRYDIASKKVTATARISVPIIGAAAPPCVP